MIRINIKHIFVLAGFIGSFLSCQDLKFGDDFLEKAPSNDVDIDVIYSNAQYARTALWSAYATLHYGLNLGNQGNQLMGSDPCGLPDRPLFIPMFGLMVYQELLYIIMALILPIMKIMAIHPNTATIKDLVG